MIRLRGGSGLGDSLYLRPIVEHLERQGKNVTVMTEFPEVFRGTRALTERFNRNNITITAHYPHGKNNDKTNQWQDILESARLGHIPLRFTWNQTDRAFVDAVRKRAGNRHIILVIGGREPMGRSDGFGAELLPWRGAFDYVLDNLRDCYTVRVGKGQKAYDLRVDEDLSNKTTVCQLMDLAQSCSAVVGQCSYAIPLAEGFDKPLMAVWARAGTESRQPYIKTITPNKILSKGSSWWVFDSDSMHSIIAQTRLFKNAFRLWGVGEDDQPVPARHSEMVHRL